MLIWLNEKVRGEKGLLNIGLHHYKITMFNLNYVIVLLPLMILLSMIFTVGCLYKISVNQNVNPQIANLRKPPMIVRLRLLAGLGLWST